MSNDASQPRGNGLSSVANALRVLALLRDQSSVRVSEISAQLDIAKSTAHRLLVTLESEGFAQKDRVDHSYRAGRILVDIGIAAVGDLDVRRKARVPMEQACATTGETVNLLMLEGARARVIDGIESEQTVRVTSRVGVLLPANVTSGGKVLLAHLAPDEVRDLFPHGLRRLTPATTGDWETFESELREVRRCGYASNFGESDEAVRGVGVPVFDRRGNAVAALAVAAPSQRLPPARVRMLADELRHSADSITRTLV